MISVVTKHRRKRYQRAQQAAQNDGKSETGSVTEEKKDK